MATKELGDGEFEYAFMHNGQLHTMRGKIKDAEMHYIENNEDRPYVCWKCKEPNPRLDALLDSGYDCFRKQRVFFEFEEEENGRFATVKRVNNEEV